MATDTSPDAASRTSFADFDLGADFDAAPESPADRLHIKRLGVVGAGTMGSGIAALAASAGVPVVLLDVPADGPDRSAIAKGALARAAKARPAPFMDAARAAYVRAGNTEDDLDLLAECDLVIEAIIEQLGPKQALYARLEAVLPPHAVVASNTSGIPMRVLTEGRGDAFRRRFLGTHFFAPARYMHLLEVIPTPDTDLAVTAAVRAFGERILGKGIVLCKDAPGFVANRLGVYGMTRTLRAMDEYGLTVDEVDGLTGPLLGRPKSATFRTADLSGLDVLQHVTAGLAQTTGEDSDLPAWFHAMVERKQLGDKTGGGFYKKVGKDIQTVDVRTGAYGPQQRLESPELKAALKAPLAQRIAGLKALPGKYGDFVRQVLVDTSRYVLETSAELAYDVPSVDRAMEWGYGHEAGPFRVMDMLGLDWLRAELARGGAAPALLAQAQGSFYRTGAAGEEALGFDGRYAPVAPLDGNVRLALVAAKPGGVLLENAGARLLDLGDGVALLEFRGKSNTLGGTVLDLLARSLEKVERDGMAGLVIGNDDPKFFSAGADLAESTGAVIAGMWDVIERSVHRFQQATQSVRYAPFPVVAAPAGMTLGGGSEFTLHADAVQAHAELYMGLVEAGVGLLPGGGGTKELLFRFTRDLEPYEEADPFEAVKRAFKLIATAATSTSALEARRLGFLRPRHDRVSMNRDRQLADAKRRVLELAPDYVAPVPQTIRALGREGLGNLRYALFSFVEAGQASAYDRYLGEQVAYVLCGGDGPARTVTEQDILDLEREAFLTLLGQEKTQERIAYTLKTGKPLRN